MLLTIILSIIMMAGLFLMLLAGVAFIQDKKYFTSAPKDVQESILPREERFHGQHAIFCSSTGSCSAIPISIRISSRNARIMLDLNSLGLIRNRMWCKSSDLWRYRQFLRGSVRYCNAIG